jgi:hypothetical protein
MNLEQFLKLQEQHGEKLVYIQESYLGKEYMFTIGNDVDEEECFKFQDKYGANGNDEIVPGLTCWVGYGDDYMNAISTKKLEDIPTDLEEFIIANIGENCYTDEEEEGEEE